MPNLMTTIGKNISNSLKKKAIRAYEKASPKVKKEIDRIVKAKATDIAYGAAKVITVAAILMVIIQIANSGGNSPKQVDEIVRTINTYYNRVNVTYNYYSKGE